jgi:hypothetical protein
MTDTPEEHGPGTAVGGFGEEDPVDGSPILAELPSELLVLVAQTLGNLLALLVSKAHLSKAPQPLKQGLPRGRGRCSSDPRARRPSRVEPDG